MEKSLFERMGGTYHQEGDCFLPDLSVSKLPAIGIWGQRRRRYLKKHRQAFYTALLLSGKLNDHLSEIDRQAEDIFSQLVRQITDCEKVTGRLKECNQLEWVRKMDNIQKRVVEIVNADLIYT